MAKGLRGLFIVGAFVIAQPFAADHAWARTDSQIEILQAELSKANIADPGSDVEKSLAASDRRFLAVCGYACASPGVDFDTAKRYGTRIIEGTSDFVEGEEHVKLIATATRYAEAYNRILLARIAKDSAPSVDYLDKRKRHYFSRASDAALDTIRKGMTKEKVREASRGKEYPPFETARNGFAFAIDERRSALFKFPDGWMPFTATEEPEIDFILSEKRLLYVRYDRGRVVAMQLYPLASA